MTVSEVLARLPSWLSEATCAVDFGLVSVTMAVYQPDVRDYRSLLRALLSLAAHGGVLKLAVRRYVSDDHLSCSTCKLSLAVAQRSTEVS